MKYTKCLSNEYHNFKHKGSDKEWWKNLNIQ
jgi:hypothetical protein